MNQSAVGTSGFFGLNYLNKYDFKLFFHIYIYMHNFAPEMVTLSDYMTVSLKQITVTLKS